MFRVAKACVIGDSGGEQKVILYKTEGEPLSAIEAIHG
jgi:hypothetical protein